MIERWVAASFLAIEKKFRRVMGLEGPMATESNPGKRRKTAIKQEVA
jgi:hypothetical protein